MGNGRGRWRESGQKLGVTRERIRQLQNVALSRLREIMQRVERVLDQRAESSHYVVVDESNQQA